MSQPNRNEFRILRVLIVMITGATVWLVVSRHETIQAQTRATNSTQASDGIAKPPAGSPAGALAYSCGVPPAREGAQLQLPVFPADQYPVKLPAVSLLGARNDLPNPYQPGVDWGQLPPGRKWGSTASITSAPDGTIWVVDRCGNSGAGGTTCAGASANVSPIFHFDTSGKLLKNFGAGMFVSPHKLTVDKTETSGSPTTEAIRSSSSARTARFC